MLVKRDQGREDSLCRFVIGVETRRENAFLFRKKIYDFTFQHIDSTKGERPRMLKLFY